MYTEQSKTFACILVVFSAIFVLFLLLPKWLLDAIVSVDDRLKVLGGLGVTLMTLLGYLFRTHASLGDLWGKRRRGGQDRPEDDFATRL